MQIGWQINFHVWDDPLAYTPSAAANRLVAAAYTLAAAAYTVVQSAYTPTSAAYMHHCEIKAS